MNKLNDSIRDNYTALIVGINSTNIDIKDKYVLYLLDPIKDSKYTLPEDYFDNVIKPNEDQELFLSYVLTSDNKTNVYNEARRYISDHNIDIIEVRPTDPEINLKPFVEPRQIFSELKSRCRTKRQMKAFNNLVNTFK